MTEADYRADAVVVGAGTAGMTFAIEAADQGLHVIAVEKSDRVGGTLHITGGAMSAAGTRLQHEAGIDDSPEAHYEEVMEIGNGEGDPDLVRLAVEEAPKTVDWLDDLGFPFTPESPGTQLSHEPYSTPREYWGVNAGKSILRTIRPLWDDYVTAGRIEPLLETECTGLIVEDGAVQGVRAQGITGPVEVRADHTVLATGGYGANPDFFAEVVPDAPTLVTNAAETSTGDGIRIAREVNADFGGPDLRLPILGGMKIERESRRVDWRRRWALVVNPDRHEPYEIYVTADGERFLREDESSVAARQETVRDLSQSAFWVVFDERGLEAPEQPIIRDRSTDFVRELAAEGDVAWQADSIRELGGRAGIDPDGLEATVAAYNEGVRAGEDPLGREFLPTPINDPPFYAILTHDTTLVTFGGLQVDADLRVLDVDGDSIPNLYAAGEALGAGAVSGGDFAGGMMVTPALGFGRVLGRQLATDRNDATELADGRDDSSRSES
jgi:fumarate reductase flavoprotein subunit